MATKKKVNIETEMNTQKAPVDNGISTYRVDNSVIGVLKRIEWPSFATAIKYAINCMIATAVMGILLTLYEFGINTIFSLFY